MASIQATINSQDFSLAAKRLDVWHEGGGIARWELELDNSSGASQILATNYPATNLGINNSLLMKGRVDNILPSVKDEAAVFSKYVKVNGRNYGRALANLFLIKKYADIKFDNLMGRTKHLAQQKYISTSNTHFSKLAPTTNSPFAKPKR